MLTEEDALRAYAAMINTFDVSHLEPLLADDFHYASQFVLDEIKSKQEYLDYITVKLQTIKTSGSRAWAEMGSLDTSWVGPCVVLAQGGKDDLVSVILAEVEGDKVKRLDLCIAPSPHSATRSGEYPIGKDPSVGLAKVT